VAAVTWDQWDRILDILGEHSDLASDCVAYEKHQNMRRFLVLKGRIAELRRKLREARL
jgi:hypothetical protein